MSALQAWYLIGFAVCAVTFAVGIAETDGLEVLGDWRVIFVILIGSAATGFIWPLMLGGFIATAVLDHRARQRRSSPGAKDQREPPG